MLANFDVLLEKYAHLLVHKGLEIKAGDWLQINTDIEMAPLVRLITKACYEAGAEKVIARYTDEILDRIHFEGQTIETLSDIPQYRIDESNYLLAKKCKRLALVSKNPNNLLGVDPEKISQATRATALALTKERIATQANEVSWLVAAGAGQKWAELVFPNLASDEAVDALWDQIFKTTLVYADDPIQAWDDHQGTLLEKANYLNDMQFDYLHYKAPGTDFKLGLPKNHIWECAGSVNAQGETFIANMPTEEVYTAPDAHRAEGTIVSSKPLSYGGVVIDQMTFRFEAGEIVQVSAKEGEETLKNLIQNNKGATRLGEVALVPHHSPISLSNVTFYNTLFDENASNHLAIGQAYATSIVDGTKMSQDELQTAGLNRSDVHVDFMVGNESMDIDGITQDGQIVPIFRQGEWAF